MLPVPMKGAGARLRRQLSVTTRRELIDAVAARYRAAGRDQKKEILNEFVEVTGFHRKHAIRVLKKASRREPSEPRQRARIYDEAVQEALTIVWEAADRICGKRLRQVITGAGRCHGTTWAFEAGCRGTRKPVVHECCHYGPVVDEGS